MLFSFLYKRLLAILFNPLSQDGRVVVTPPPPHFRVFPRAVFAFSLRLPIGQFTYPLSRYHAGPSPPERSEERRKNVARTGLDTHVSIKIFKNFCHEKSWSEGGGGGLQKKTPPSWEGRGGSKNKQIFKTLIFLFFPFVITMTMLLKYLKHKIDLVRCFTFNLKVEQFIGKIKAFHSNSL